MLINYRFVVCLLIFTLLPSTPLHASTKALKSPLKGKTVILDPGHGGKDHGYCKKNNVCEKDTDISIAKKLERSLTEKGAAVFLTHDQTDGGFISWLGAKPETGLDQRILMAGEKKADVFISIHCNASPKPHRAGSVVFYRSGSMGGKKLGEQIQKELVRMPDNGKNTASPGSYYLLNRLDIPAVVVETCYLTHRTDKNNIGSHKYQDKIAGAIFRGISDYLAGEAHQDKKITRTEVYPKMSLPVTSQNTVKPPPDIKTGDIAVEDGRATVDIKTPRSGLSLGGEEEYMAVHTLVINSLKIKGVKEVRLTLNGKEAKTLAGHIDISSYFTSRSPVCSSLPGGLKEGKKARVAIVIDDFGQHNTSGVREILSLGIPVTCAVMPNMENTLSQAEEASQKGHQVIVHLPLEPIRGKKSWLGPGSVTTRQTEDEIKSTVREDFNVVPHAVGFNNHMGSAATANARVMRSILQVAREKEFFVLDSKTTGKTTIPSLSKELGITCLSRDIFLDEVKSPQHVKKQLHKLSQKALEKGSAVAIGHVGQGGKITARALEEMIPVMEKMGIEFVYLSEIDL